MGPGLARGFLLNERRAALPRRSSEPPTVPAGPDSPDGYRDDPAVLIRAVARRALSNQQVGVGIAAGGRCPHGRDVSLAIDP